MSWVYNVTESHRSDMSSDIAVISLTQRQTAQPDQDIQQLLALTAADRQRSRFPCHTEQGVAVLLNLPRGTVLRDGDLLTTEADDWWVRVVAKAEPVLRVTAPTPLKLLQAAYHLGNRHVPLEITPEALKLSADPVLQDMLEHLGLQVTPAQEPFHPETGAYSHSH
jgi:urease accessory protein